MEYLEAKELTNGNEKAAKALMAGDKPEIKTIETSPFGGVKKGVFLGGECLETYWNNEPIRYRSAMLYVAKLTYTSI